MYAGREGWGREIALMCETQRDALSSQRGADAEKRLPDAHPIDIGRFERIERNDGVWWANGSDHTK
ncbi:hypothetical protein GCM10011430_03060 [Oxalicibacterium solurbis]|uniref:Uncharacterized protein n=1 Tax=Oxalicibacterium solurbis TaxID=69280 RepID=A0A8J3F327_9BURK|nr:hypothetical protein GCM10011430_03060 [Oxalicibacterium solurbis]